LRAKIVDRALSKIYQELGNNYKVIDSNIVFSNFKIDIDHKTGDIANEIQGTATLKSAGYLLRSSEIEVLINKLYEKNLDKEYKLLNNSINIKSIKLEKLEDDRYNIELESIAHIIPDINLRDLKYRLTGMKKENVIDILDNHDNINEFNIKGENEKIPQIPFAINIVIKKPDSIRVFNN